MCIFSDGVPVTVGGNNGLRVALHGMASFWTQTRRRGMRHQQPRFASHGRLHSVVLIFPSLLAACFSKIRPAIIPRHDPAAGTTSAGTARQGDPVVRHKSQTSKPHDPAAAPDRSFTSNLSGQAGGRVGRWLFYQRSPFPRRATAGKRAGKAASASHDGIFHPWQGKRGLTQVS